MTDEAAKTSAGSALGAMTAGELLTRTTWDQIEADGVLTLEEVEAELEAKGFPSDSHDWLHD